jgi:hypothetical protein
MGEGLPLAWDAVPLGLTALAMDESTPVMLSSLSLSREDWCKCRNGV